MATAMLARPGTKYGPCNEPCAHRDCEITRAGAALLCRHCGLAIGYETPMYRDDDAYDRLNGIGYVHAACEYAAADAAEAACQSAVRQLEQDEHDAAIADGGMWS